MVEIHQLAAAIYLAAGIGALVGVVLPAPRMSRGAAWGLGFGAIVQALAFATLHGGDGPPINSLPVVLAWCAWLGVLFAMLLALRVRLPGLTAVVGPLAFLSVFVASVGWDRSGAAEEGVTGAWPHIHVLLSSGGVSLLGIAGLAGLVFLYEHRRLKAKPPTPARIPLPSLEALDRVNVVSTSVGFSLLSLGIATGMVWLYDAEGRIWTGTSHATWMVISWVIYAGLVIARTAGRQGARQAAASALAGFAFLVFGVMGVGVMS
ncbi:MAG: cytochrome c biogenesis protein CcsA [Myxococcota bacterium]|jgi:ABC-type uncharacterized transport system permease subunit|nr:cytochrome c biogenesis protein CcsA [Myxococcota bacterium]